jgi:hypothetical protein
MHRYPVESQIEQKNGYVKVKVTENKWQGLGAYLLTKAGVKIVEGDRVFFADGDRTNRSVDNLRRIHFNTVKFVLLPTSRPIYIPDVKAAKPKTEQIPFGIKRPIERKIYQVA